MRVRCAWADISEDIQAGVAHAVGAAAPLSWEATWCKRWQNRLPTSTLHALCRGAAVSRSA